MFPALRRARAFSATGKRRRRRTEAIARLATCVPVCIVRQMDSRSLIKQLQAAGWRLRSVSGSHHVFVHPDRPGHLTVPHPKKDLGIGLVRKLLKQAGIE